MPKKEKKSKEKMWVKLTYVDGEVDVEELYAPGFDPKKGPKVKKDSKTQNVTIVSNGEEVVFPINMWNHGAGFGSVTLEYIEDEEV